MVKFVKKAVVGLMAASLIFGAVPYTAVNVKAATVTKGEYDFSNMTVRRIWFNTEDPVFLVDNYQRVWLDDNTNVLAYGNAKTTTADGDLMAPMKEACAELGIGYTEEGNDVTITMNGQTLKFTIGSKDVVLDGKTISGALTDAQVPAKVNVKEQAAEYNTYLTGDYFVTYLPVAYVFNTFGADVGYDGNIQSFYAAVPMFNNDIMPTFETAAIGYGYRYDVFLMANLEDVNLPLEDAVADSIVSLQNEDGGWQILPVNFDLRQADAASKLGTLKDASSLEEGSTVAQLRYLGRYITENKPEDKKYQDAFLKGLDYIVKNQSANGGWQMMPTAAEGFNGNVVIGNNVTTEVLSFLQDVAVLNDQNFVFARRNADVEAIKAAYKKGNDFLAGSQLANEGTLAGWATQVKADGTVTMGRTYEREAVSAFTTKAVAEYLMSIHDPSEEIKTAVESSLKWLAEVKIADKEVEYVKDTSMNNGFDIFVVEGEGTWARDYVYDVDAKAYRPLYADVDPTMNDQIMVHVDPNNPNPSYNTEDMILYATRTTVEYLSNDLATVLLSEGYETWKGYLANGFPEIPVDPVEPAEPETPTTGDMSNAWSFILLGAASLAALAGSVVYFENKKRRA